MLKPLLFTWVIGSMAVAASAETSRVAIEIGGEIGTPLLKVDSNGPSAADSAGNLWFIQGLGGTIQSTPWRIFKGKTQDDLVFQYEFIPDKHWDRRHGDDTWWPEGLWIDPADGRWYAIMHTEFNYNKYARRPGKGYSIDRMSSIGLAVSTDLGRTWTYSGEIITSDHSSAPAYWSDKNYWRQGPGDPSLYVDKNFFYVYYNSRWVNRDDTNALYSGVRVARSPLPARMQPGKWTKWYLGRWSTAGLGGHDSDVFNDDYSDTATIFWSQSRKLYVAVTLSHWHLDERHKEAYGGFVSTATDLSRQNWTQAIATLDTAQKGWYSWALDALRGSRYVMDTDIFRWCSGDFGNFNGDSRVHCHAAKLTDPPSKPTILQPRYPPESVDDYSPGWDRVHCSAATQSRPHATCRSVP